MAELLTVIAIAALMLAIALPDMRQMIRAQQLKAALNDLFGAIDLTRTQAIARGRRVLLVAAGGDTPDWRLGWVVFVDDDGDRRPGGAEEILLRHGPLADGITVDATFSSQLGAPYLAYNSMGRSCSDASSLTARWGTLSLVQDKQTRRIIINMLGRARTCDPARPRSNCGDAGPDP
ncbi:MAG: GspH/FimT family protein [Massilia sp.]|nr:GspH/FimT family protein [Massilia sp.]